MYQPSEAFKTAAMAEVKEVDSYIVHGTQTITAADDLISTKVDAENHIGQVVMRLLTTQMTGNHSDLNGETIGLFSGIKVGGSFEYLNYGTFIVRDVTENKENGTTEAKAYDKMLYTYTPYEPDQFTYPATIKQVAQKLCQRCGLTLGSTSWPNSGLIIAADRYEGIEGTQYVDVLNDIASCSGTIAMISNDSLVFKKPVGATETLREANLMTYKVDNKYGPINAVVLARSPQEDNVALRDEVSIEANGLTEWRTDNNQLIDDQRENAIPDLYTGLAGLTYYPFEAKTEGHMWYEVGDMVNMNVDGETKPVLITNISLLIDGSVEEVLKGTAQESAGTNYSRVGNISRRLRRTELIVDKQAGIIRSVVEQVTEQGEKISEIEQTAETISITVGEVSEGLQRQQTTFSVESDGAYIKQGREGYYSKFTDEGMEVYSNGEKIAEATADTFKAPSFTTDNWTMREEDGGTILNFFRGEL